MLTYLLAVLAACANATSSVLQRKANRELPDELGVGPRIVLRLVREPVWLLGVLAVICGFLLQATALSIGALSIVEPILVFELPLTLLLASRVFRSGLHRREWASAFGMTAGLGGVLYVLSPSGGTPNSVGFSVWAAAAAATLGVVAAMAALGRRAAAAGSGNAAAAYGVAAGTQFGLTAALMKGAMSRSQYGVGAIFTSWQLYAMVATGVTGMLLMQLAMRAGRLLAAQPGLTLSDPLVSVLWGVFAFHEQVRDGWHTVVAVIGGVLIVTSVLVLARSPLLAAHNGEAGGHHPGSPDG